MEKLSDPFLPNTREHKTRRTSQNKSSTSRIIRYPKKNYSSFHSALIIFLKLVEITLSVFASKNKIFRENGKRLSLNPLHFSLGHFYLCN